MTTALIFAGGTGTRMHTTGIPKQFLSVFGKPIIVYTIEKFQKHQLIDSIIVVCVKSHLSLMKNIVQNYNLTKVSNIVAGGETGQESIFNGLESIKTFCSNNDTVLIHDGVRPLIDEDIITRNIQSVQRYGNGISASFATETVCQRKNNECIAQVFPRQNMLVAKAPQSFKLGDIFDAHMKAKKEGVFAIDSASLMSRYGHTLYYVHCDTNNIKITTPIDYYLFKAILEAQESMQIIGL